MSETDRSPIDGNAYSANRERHSPAVLDPGFDVWAWEPYYFTSPFIFRFINVGYHFSYHLSIWALGFVALSRGSVRRSPSDTTQLHVDV